MMYWISIKHTLTDKTRCFNKPLVSWLLPKHTLLVQLGPNLALACPVGPSQSWAVKPDFSPLPIGNISITHLNSNSNSHDLSLTVLAKLVCLWYMSTQWESRQVHCENELLTGLDLIEHVNLLKSHILNKFHILSATTQLCVQVTLGYLHAWCIAVGRQLSKDMDVRCKKMHFLNIWKCRGKIQHFFGSM